MIKYEIDGTIKGEVSVETICWVVDHLDFENLFKSINKINSNDERKSELDHFLSVCFGKIAEFFVSRNIYSFLNNEKVVPEPEKNLR